MRESARLGIAVLSAVIVTKNELMLLMLGFAPGFGWGSFGPPLATLSS